MTAVAAENVLTLDLGKPQPKQIDFLKAKNKYIAYGGARGGGKSWAVRYKAKLLALYYAGIKILIIRRTFPELRNNHIDILRIELKDIATYNASDKRFTFPNGSTITFGYCANDGDVLQYQGAEYDIIFIDEATQLKEEWLQIFPACLRGVNDFPKRIYYPCNPGGVGHAYIKRLFIDCNYKSAERPDDYVFIPATVRDNPALLAAQPDYIAQLEALPYHRRRAWLYGDWDIFEGAFFEEFVNDREHYNDRQYTHVIAPFDIPAAWTIYRTFDWGYSRPFSVGWWAVDYEGVLYRILELYGVGNEADEGIKWTNQQIFSEIARIEREHDWLKGKHIIGIADPAIWQKESTGISIYDVAIKHGVRFRKADNSRIPGWMQVRYRLQFDDEGYPRMYIFSNCKQLIRTMPLMIFSDKKPEDLDDNLEDHACDEMRYMCMHRPIKPMIKKEPEEYKQYKLFFDPLDQYNKQDIGRYRSIN